MNYYCSICKKSIEPDVYNYSMKNYNKVLCMQHQKSKEITSNKNAPTKEAYKLGMALKARGCPVEFEKWDGYKHIDIAIVEARVNIEVDGAHHNFDKKQALADLKRTYYSFKKNYLTLRIPNSLVKDQKTIEETAEYIVDFLNSRNQQLDEDY